METLVYVGEDRNQSHDKVNSPCPARFRSFLSRNFGGIHCRKFQFCSHVKSPSRKITVPAASLSPSCYSQRFLSSSYNSYPVAKTPFKANTTTWPICPYEDINKNQKPFSERLSTETASFYYSELWAGPAYSNSPPPSSLPMPGFSLRSRRTVSLHLLATRRMVELPPAAKSAPTSPARRDNPSGDELFRTSDSATKTLRCILNLGDPDD